MNTKLCKGEITGLGYTIFEWTRDGCMYEDLKQALVDRFSHKL